MTTIELKITGLDRLERILKDFKSSGQIEKLIHKAIKEALEPEPLCPVCRKEMEICIGGEWIPNEADNYYYIACTNCSLKTWRFDTREEAMDLIKKWNKRA